MRTTDPMLVPALVCLVVVGCDAYRGRGNMSMKFGTLTAKRVVSSVFSPFRAITNTIRNHFSYKTRNDLELKSGIANFYDESSEIWLDVWGEHMHHGYYPSPTYSNHQSAQIDMIDRSLEFAYGKDPIFIPKSMVDVGCGVGGSSRHISRKYNCTATGLSLSPYQIQRAKQFTKEQNLTHMCEYGVNDAMKMPFKDNSFDLTWSMESGEHMPDKNKFVDELVRVTTPGGRIIIVTWCHRELKQGETALRPREQALLHKINDAYFLPEWCPSSTYVKYAKKLGLVDVRNDDWSEFIAPFWPAVFKSALKPRNFIRMLRSGMTVIKATIASLWMLRGFKRDIVKFVIITARKPV
jgi:tocopherol O-methyltransferase